MHVRSYSLKSKASFQLTEDGPKSPPFILKRQLQAGGEMTAQTSSSKVLPVARGRCTFFFLLPLSVNGEALGSLVVARQLHQDCCGKWRSAGRGTWRVRHAGHDWKNVQFTKDSNQRNHIRCVVLEVLCCRVRTIISSNMFHRNDKKGNGAADPGGHILSLSWFVIATVTWCNKCFCNHGLFKPSDAVIQTTIILLCFFFTSGDTVGDCSSESNCFLFIIWEIWASTVHLMLLIWLLGYCCG